MSNQMETHSKKERNGRRDFLKLSGLGTAGTLLSTVTMNVPHVHAAENNTLNVALVGCGGRGGGALLNALNTDGPKKVVALADAFPQRITALLRRLADHSEGAVDVPSEYQFAGLDGYRKAIDAVGSGGVILLATPPAFRPREVEYAVEKGVHVFMEKSFGVDSPGVRRILKAGEAAKAKNLKVIGGLMTRHKVSMQHAIEQIRSGIIGDVITCWAYRKHGPVGFDPRREGESIVAHQVRNYSNFTWLNGSFILDWLIHNLDVCCWAKGEYPISAQGMAGRETRTEQDQLFDHFAVEYTFADGTRLFLQGRHQHGSWSCFQSTIHGTTGAAILGEGVPIPRIYKGHNPDSNNIIWEYSGPPFRNEYQFGHDLLFDAIRNDKPLNETEHCVQSTMVGILGRMAAESGQVITWEDAFNSNRELAPNLEQLTFDSQAPIMPNENGDYPLPIPGQTEVLQKQSRNRKACTCLERVRNCSGLDKGKFVVPR
jgi:predicted dehydrogenase